MSEDDNRHAVPAAEFFGALKIVPLPEGTKAEAVFILAKLENGEWSARSVGDSYNRTEFLGQLVAYTHGLTQAEADGWFEDDDKLT